MLEPVVVHPEKAFQDAIAAVIHERLSQARRFVVVESFGLDLGVFIDGPHGAHLRLLEVKVFAAGRMGGVGFGTSRGQGPQVDLLLCEEPILALLDSTVRWVYADATQPAGTARYALFTCSAAKAAAMGRVARGKQNNLRISALREQLLRWDQLCDGIQRFLLE